MPPAEEFFDADDPTDQGAVPQHQPPVNNPHGLSLKDGIENGGIGKEGLKAGHDGHAAPQPAIGEEAQLPERPGEGTAVEQIEHLAEDKCIDRYGPGQVLIARGLNLHFKKAECPHEQQEAHEHDSENEGTVEDRFPRFPGLAGHDAGLLGLKGQCKP